MTYGEWRERGISHIKHVYDLYNDCWDDLTNMELYSLWFHISRDFKDVSKMSHREVWNRIQVLHEPKPPRNIRPLDNITLPKPSFTFKRSEILNVAFIAIIGWQVLKAFKSGSFLPAMLVVMFAILLQMIRIHDKG